MRIIIQEIEHQTLGETQPNFPEVEVPGDTASSENVRLQEVIDGELAGTETTAERFTAIAEGDNLTNCWRKSK